MDNLTWQEFVYLAIKRYNEELEKACEEALQSGEYGVLELTGCIPKPCALVPYGQIWKAPTWEAAVGYWCKLQEEKVRGVEGA